MQQGHDVTKMKEAEQRRRQSQRIKGMLAFIITVIVLMFGLALFHN